MHDDIRKFSLEGELGEPNIVTTKERLVGHLESLMRDYGYVPAIDLDPQFVLNYNDEHKSFNFSLSVYGIHVGKERSWEISGVAGGKEIPKFTPSAKLKQS